MGKGEVKERRRSGFGYLGVGDRLHIVAAAIAGLIRTGGA